MFWALWALGMHLVHIHTQRQNTCTYQLKFNNWFEGGENKMPIMLEKEKKKNSFINHSLKDDLQLGTRAQPSKRPAVRHNGLSIQP